MNANQMLGLVAIARQRPQVASLLTRHLVGRLQHAAAKGTEHSPPEHITVVATDICNLHCKMCHYAFSDAPGYQLNRVGHMSPWLFRKLMDEVPGRPLVSFTGGEPLLHPDIAELVAYAKGKRRFCNLATNGWFLERRAEEVAEAGLDFLTVSVDGPPDVHDRVRGLRSFERLAAGVQAVLAQPRRPVVFVSMAISDLNHHRLVEMFELASAWGVDGLNFNHLWMQSPAMVAAHNGSSSLFTADEVAWDLHPERVDAARVASELETIRSRVRYSSPIVTTTPDLGGEQVVTWYREPERFVKYDSTRCAWVRMKVWPDGNVKPCREWVAGNVAERHAMEVWSSDRFRSFRRLLAERGALPICARCCYLAYR